MTCESSRRKRLDRSVEPRPQGREGLERRAVREQPLQVAKSRPRDREHPHGGDRQGNVGDVGHERSARDEVRRDAREQDVDPRARKPSPAANAIQRHSGRKRPTSRRTAWRSSGGAGVASGSIGGSPRRALAALGAWTGPTPEATPPRRTRRRGPVRCGPVATTRPPSSSTSSSARPISIGSCDATRTVRSPRSLSSAGPRRRRPPGRGPPSARPAGRTGSRRGAPGRWRGGAPDPR